MIPAHAGCADHELAVHTCLDGALLDMGVVDSVASLAITVLRGVMARNRQVRCQAAALCSDVSRRHASDQSREAGTAEDSSANPRAANDADHILQLVLAIGMIPLGIGSSLAPDNQSKHRALATWGAAFHRDETTRPIPGDST